MSVDAWPHVKIFATKHELGMISAKHGVAVWFAGPPMYMTLHMHFLRTYMPRPKYAIMSTYQILLSRTTLPLYGGFPWVSPVDKWTKNIETITSSNSRS